MLQTEVNDLESNIRIIGPAEDNDESRRRLSNEKSRPDGIARMGDSRPPFLHSIEGRWALRRTSNLEADRPCAKTGAGRQALPSLQQG